MEKSEGAPLSQSDSAKKFISAKDGADEIKKEKEKMKEEKKGAPSVTEVRKHIKYLVLEHEKKEQAANATTYALIKKDVGEEGKDPFASLPIENWDAPTPQDIYGAVGVKKNKKKLGGRVGYKRRDR